MKYGFECEFFVRDESGAFVMCPSAIPHDECLYLAEARGDPHSDPMKAAYLFECERARMIDEAAKHNVYLDSTTAWTNLPAELARRALRLGGKAPMPVERGNMYGIDYKPSDRLARAGMHIHFSNQIEVWDGNRKITTVNGQIDMPRFIRALDEKFKDEIKAARRIPGMYEMKPHGFEYRSLPNTINPGAVARAILAIQ